MVRKKEERMGTSFCKVSLNFNNFIEDVELVEIPMGGYNFTRSNNTGDKQSKLDQFLVSKELLDSFHNMYVLTLHKNLYDHRSIFIKEDDFNYGPVPFKLFDSWLDIEGFEETILTIWESSSFDLKNANKFIEFKNKIEISKV